MALGDATTELVKKNANYLIDGADYGLDGFRAGTLNTSVEPAMKAIGMGGREAIGGKLLLTPAVLWFRPHRFNRIQPEFGFPLEEIVQVLDVSKGLSARWRS